MALPMVCLVSAGPLWCAGLTPVPPAAPTVAEISKQVDQHYNRLHSLRVQFTETYQGMGMKRTESGTLLIGKARSHAVGLFQPGGQGFCHR